MAGSGGPPGVPKTLSKLPEGVCSAAAVGSPHRDLLRHSPLLLDLLGWKGLLALGEPFRRFVAFQVFVSKSLWQVLHDTVKALLRLVGWLSAPVPALRRAALLGLRLQLHRWHIALAAALAGAAVAGSVRAVHELTDERARRRRALRRIMANADCYEDWAKAAIELDQISQQSRTEALSASQRQQRLFDQRLLRQRCAHLRAVRAGGDAAELVFAIRADLLRNLGNMANSELHEHCYIAPTPIPEYIAEVNESLAHLVAAPASELTLEQKAEFLQETRHVFGRTALVLSGGGALGAFHLGVVKTLFEQRLLPRILSGSSVGSIICAVIATRTDEQLKEVFDHMGEFDLSFFSNSTLSQFLRHFLLKGTLQDIEVLQKRLRRLLGDLTFLEAFKRSGRVLNVAVTAADTNEPPRLLNHLTAPDVVIWSAVACSSAFPGLFKPQELLARNRRGEFVRYTADMMRENERRWRDGSLEEDLPMRGLSELFNVNYFLVSQTNPHIIPALNLKKRFNRKLGRLLEAEWKHRCQQIMEVLPGWAPSKWLKVVSQPWEGDVTMVLPSTLWQLRKAVTNPSKEDLQAAVRQGERKTWAKISAIQCNCAIEMQLDKCLAQVTAQRLEMHRARHAPPPSPSLAGTGAPGVSGGASGPPPVSRARSGMGSRIPSWLHMPALGIPSVPSLESVGEYGSSNNLLMHLVNPWQPSSAGASTNGGALGGAHERINGGSAPSVHAPPPTEADLAALPESLDVAVIDEGQDNPLPFDCCDRSVALNIWDAITPRGSLVHHSRWGEGGEGLDVIAP